MTRLAVYTQDISDRLSNELRIGNGAQIDEPGTIGVDVGHASLQAQREPGLAHPAGTDEGQQARFTVQLSQASQLAFPTDELIDLGRYVANRARARPPTRAYGCLQPRLVSDHIRTFHGD